MNVTVTGWCLPSIATNSWCVPCENKMRFKWVNRTVIVSQCRYCRCSKTSDSTIPVVENGDNTTECVFYWEVNYSIHGHSHRISRQNLNQIYVQIKYINFEAKRPCWSNYLSLIGRKNWLITCWSKIWLIFDVTFIIIHAIPTVIPFTSHASILVSKVYVEFKNRLHGEKT